MSQHPDDSRVEVRLLSVVLAYEVSKDMITSGIWMLSPETMIGKVGKLSSNPMLFAYTWMALSLFVAPYWMLQVTGLGQQFRPIITRLACWAILCSCVFWVYLAYLGKNLDYEYITYAFVFHGLTCIFMAAILANGLNNTQKRAQGRLP